MCCDVLKQIPFIIQPQVKLKRPMIIASALIKLPPYVLVKTLIFSAALQRPVAGKPTKIGGGCFRMIGSPSHKDSKTLKIFLVG